MVKTIKNLTNRLPGISLVKAYAHRTVSSILYNVPATVINTEFPIPYHIKRKSK